MRFTFKKAERLCSQIAIDKLFSEGKSFTVFPFKVIFLDRSFKTDFPAQLLISVSKKKLKKAVDRNKIKRQLREAYRKNKYIIYDYLASIEKQYAIGIVFIGDQIFDSIFIEEKMQKLLSRLCEQFKKNHQ